MARRRQIILLHSPDAATVTGETPAMGTLPEFLEMLRPFGLAPDGSGPEGYGEAIGMVLLYGPGMTIEVPTGGREIIQAMVTLSDEDFAFPVLMRLCKARALRMLDPETGRSFG